MGRLAGSLWDPSDVISACSAVERRAATFPFDGQFPTPQYPVHSVLDKIFCDLLLLSTGNCPFKLNHNVSLSKTICSTAIDHAVVLSSGYFTPLNSSEVPTKVVSPNACYCSNLTCIMMREWYVTSCVASRYSAWRSPASPRSWFPTGTLYVLACLQHHSAWDGRPDLPHQLQYSRWILPPGQLCCSNQPYPADL